MKDKARRPRPTRSTGGDAPQELLEQEEIFPDNQEMQDLLAAQRAEHGALSTPDAAPTQKPKGRGPGVGSLIAAWLDDADLQNLLSEEQQEGIVWDESEKDANALEADIIGRDEYRIPKLRISSVDKEGVQAAAVHADGVKLQELPKAQDQHRGRLTVDDASTGAVSAAGASAASVELDAVQVDRGWAGGKGDVIQEFMTQPGDTGVAVESATVRGLKAGGAELDQLQVQDGQALISQGKEGLDAQAQVGGLSASGVSGQGGSAAQLQASGLSVAGGARGDQRFGAGRVDQLSASGLQGGGLSVDQAQLSGLQGGGSGDRLSASMTGAQASGVSYTDGGDQSQVEQLSAGPGSLSIDGDAYEAQLTDASAKGLSHQGQLGGGGGGMDPGLMRQLMALVQDARAQASVPMTPGQYGEGGGKMRVYEGTAMMVELRVEDGRLVPADTKLTSSRELGTLLWTSVRGAYMTEDGRVMLDVKGWGDQDLTQQIKDGVGLGGSGGLPLDLATLSQAQPPATAPSRSRRPPPQDALDLANATGKGSLSLGPGTLQSGGLSATLADGGPGANTVEVDRSKADRMSASVTRLVLSALGMNVGGAEVDVQGLEVEGLAGSQQGQGVQGGADALTVGAVGVKGKT